MLAQSEAVEATFVGASLGHCGGVVMRHDVIGASIGEPVKFITFRSTVAFALSALAGVRIFRRFSAYRSNTNG